MVEGWSGGGVERLFEMVRIWDGLDQKMKCSANSLGLPLQGNKILLGYVAKVLKVIEL